MALRLLLVGFALFSVYSLYAREAREIFFPVTISGCDVGTRDDNKTYQDYAVLKLPPSYTANGTPTRLVYMAHGAGGGVSENSWFLNQFALQKQLLENGYAVFDVNGGRVENMGGRLAVASAFNAWRHIVENYNVYPKIIVGGFSMGGLTSTNFVCQHSAIVLAHVMYSPVLDLYEQVWKNPWLKSTRKALAEVYEFDDPDGVSFDSCAVRGMNPIDRYSFLSHGMRAKLHPVPVKIWHGTGDKVVTVGTSRRFYEEVRRAGGKAELTEIDSDDHGLSCGNAAINRELLSFIKDFN